MNNQLAAKDVETEALKKQLAEVNAKLEAKENHALATAKPIGQMQAEYAVSSKSTKKSKKHKKRQNKKK